MHSYTNNVSKLTAIVRQNTPHKRACYASMPLAVIK